MHSMASGHFEFESEGFRAKRHRDRAHCFRGSEIHGKIGVAGGIGRNLAAAGTGKLKPHGQTGIVGRKHCRPLGREAHQRHRVFTGTRFNAL